MIVMQPRIARSVLRQRWSSAGDGPTRSNGMIGLFNPAPGWRMVPLAVDDADADSDRGNKDLRLPARSARAIAAGAIKSP